MLDKYINQIICDDCIKVMKELPDKCVDLVLTDPPYLINYQTGYRKDKAHNFCSTIANDDNPKLIIQAIQQMYRILKDNSALYLFCSAVKVDFFKQELEAAFGRQYEICFYVNKGRKIINGTRWSDVWEEPRVVGNYQVHQNQKPLFLIERAILSSSNENDLVLDCFLGSGTTAVACKATNRRYIGIEINEKYCEIARSRVETQATPML